MEAKKIAQHALEFIGGQPTVNAYYNEDESKSIDIMECKENNSEDTTIATIGLSAFDIAKTTEDGKDLRVELLMAGLAGTDVFGQILSQVAFEIQDMGDCYFGMIVENVISPYVEQTNLRHVILMSPVFWESYKPLDLEDACVTWLLAVPIRDDEKDFIEKHGIDAFDESMSKANIDVTDFLRTSCV